MGLYLLGLLLVGRNGINRSGDAIDAPAHVQLILSGGVILITLMLLASVVAMLKRLRGATGAARQQLRVVALGATGVGVALLVLIIGQGFNGGRQLWWSSVPLYVSYLALVVCIGVAVLRYRLYDVEVIVSRAVVLAIATAFVAVGYVGLVVLLGRTVEDTTGGGFWWSLLATVAVALAFQPLRRRVLRLADRLAYGNRAAPYDALADFSARIGRSPATGELLPTIAAAAGEAVHARRAVVRLDGDDGAGLAVAWPEAEDPEQSDGSPLGTAVVPIKDSSGQLGSMMLTLPPGRDIRPLERRLLSDIAEQAALALRNVRLELELAERVRQLDRRTRELSASRNRIMGAVDTERRRLESSIAERVLPTVVRLRAEVARAAIDGAQAERIEECVVLATEAVEALRELTRGIYPTNLTRSGLGPALQSRAATMRRTDAVRFDPALATARFPERVEAAAYYCCVEVLEHAAGEVRLTVDDRGDLVLVIHGVDVDALNRLAIVDRIEACGGALHLADPESGTALQIRFPACSPVPAPGQEGRLDPTTPAAGVPG
jgi:signal transduction histidine kinase